MYLYFLIIEFFNPCTYFTVPVIWELFKFSQYLFDRYISNCLDCLHFYIYISGLFLEK